MEITWLGHSCFRLKGKEATLVTDPFSVSSGYSLGKLTAQIVTVSHPHPQHSFVAGVGGSPRVVKGPGEYEIAGVLITGIKTFHDVSGGTQRGSNTVYMIDLEEVRVCHLGDIGHVPTPEQVGELGGVDVLLVPVGGVSTIDATLAGETIRLLEPRVTIPMHFKTAVTTLELEPLDRFLKEMGLKEAQLQPKFNVTKATLPSQPQVLILDHRR